MSRWWRCWSLRGLTLSHKTQYVDAAKHGTGALALTPHISQRHWQHGETPLDHAEDPMIRRMLMFQLRHGHTDEL